MSAFICKLFHATQANSGKITTFRGYSSLTLACAALLEPRGSKLAAIKFTLNAKMLKISYADYLGLSPAISAQFTLKMCVTAQNREKITKTAFLRGEGSRSSMLTFL